eukprot:2145355-Pyramimonas_sp.AAC.1
MQAVEDGTLVQAPPLPQGLKAFSDEEISDTTGSVFQRVRPTPSLDTLHRIMDKHRPNGDATSAL